MFIATGSLVSASYAPEEEEEMNVHSLTRSKSDRMISGVCGGIARAYRFDTVVVRGVFVVLGLVNIGIAAIVYVAAIFLIPEEILSVESGTQRPGWRYDPWTGESLSQPAGDVVIVDTAPTGFSTDVLAEIADEGQKIQTNSPTTETDAPPPHRPNDDEV